MPRMIRRQMNDSLARPKRNAVAVPSKLNTLAALATASTASVRNDGPPITLRCTEVKRAGRRCKGKSERRSDKCKDHSQ